MLHTSRCWRSKKKKMMHCVKNVASFFSQGTRLAEAESLPLTWSQTSLVAFHLPLLNYRYQVPLTWARMLLSVDCLAASMLNCQTQVGREFILCHVCLTLFSSYYFERGFFGLPGFHLVQAAPWKWDCHVESHQGRLLVPTSSIDASPWITQGG